MVTNNRAGLELRKKVIDRPASERPRERLFRATGRGPRRLDGFVSVSTPSGSLSFDAARQSMDVLAGRVDAFVGAWGTGASPPDLNPFLPDGGEVRRLTLIELIKVDLEYRWLSRCCPKRLSEYFAEFPELVRDHIPCDLLYEEFHIRKQTGEEVDAEEYLHAFPGHTAEIASILDIEQAYETTAFFRRAKQLRVAGIAAGDTIDDFELLAELGAGAFAKVFLGRQKSMQRILAVKDLSRRRHGATDTGAARSRQHRPRVRPAYNSGSQAPPFVYAVHCRRNAAGRDPACAANPAGEADGRNAAGQ